MKVAVVCNRDRSGVINVFGWQNTELYDPRTLEAVAAALEARGHNVRVIEGNMHVIEQLREFMPGVVRRERPGLVFNMAYGIQGVSRYTHLPAMLEMLGVPYVGSGPQAHALALDKVIAKILFDSHGISTPRFWNFASADDSFDDLVFPVIVKPKMEAASSGIKIVHNETDLREAVGVLIERFNQHVLVEQFIEGRELTVGLLGNGDVEVLPVLELDLAGDPTRIRDDEENSPLDKICPAPLPPHKIAELETMARRAFQVVGLHDFARIDVRMDRDGNMYLLEINSMADLGPDGAYVHSAKTAGYTYETLINRVLDVAAVRYFGDQVLDSASSASVALSEPGRESVAARARGYLRSQARTHEDLLRNLVDTHSTVGNFDCVTSHLQRLGFNRSGAQLGEDDTLYFTNHGNVENDVMLVLPWDDAEAGSAFVSFRAEENRLYGSGVAQPYGSLAVALAALRALRYVRQLRKVDCGLLLCRRDLIHNGGPKLIGRLAERSRCVLGLAPTDIEGGLVVSRCGEAAYQIKLGYHQAKQRLDSVAAVSALCQRLIAVGKQAGSQTDGEDPKLRVGITRLDVRGRADQPPTRARAEIHVYFQEMDDGQRIDRELRELMNRSTVPGLRFHLEGGIVVPPIRESEPGWKLYRDVEVLAEKINVSVSPERLWQSSELGLVPAETAILDGLGPLGSGQGTAEEQVLRHSLVDRAGLLAMTIHRVASQKR
jgi:D-alanine-D-alanine ligase